MSQAGSIEMIDGLVSIVIPAYNAAALIEETLASILAQTYPSIEIIVVDDGSTDDTVAIVEKFAPRVQLARQKNSGGCSSPRNHGLRLARGEFVTFFDADDLMVPAKLEQQVEFLRRHAQCDAVLMDYRNFDDDGEAAESHFESCTQLQGEHRRHGGREFVLEPAVATRILITENYAIAGSPLIRRSVFDRIYAFDEDLRASEDFDLAYRLARQSGLGIIVDVGFLRRFHESNMSKRIAHVLHYKIESRSRLMKAEMNSDNRRLLARQVASHHLSMAEFNHRAQPGSSLRHVWSALRLGHPPNLRVAKGLVRCALAAVRPA